MREERGARKHSLPTDARLPEARRHPAKRPTKPPASPAHPLLTAKWPARCVGQRPPPKGRGSASRLVTQHGRRTPPAGQPSGRPPVPRLCASRRRAELGAQGSRQTSTSLAATSSDRLTPLPQPGLSRVTATAANGSAELPRGGGEKEGWGGETANGALRMFPGGEAVAAPPPRPLGGGRLAGRDSFAPGWQMRRGFLLLAGNTVQGTWLGPAVSCPTQGVCPCSVCWLELARAAWEGGTD